MTSPTFTERRRHPRYDLVAQVRVKRGRVDYVMELSNISMSGALVDMGTLDPPAWLEPERTVEIHLVHPEDYETVKVSGRIVRVDAAADRTSMAVEFQQLEADELAGLARLIAVAEGGTDVPKPPPLPS